VKVALVSYKGIPFICIKAAASAACRVLPLKFSGIIHAPSASYTPILGSTGFSGVGNHWWPHHPDEEQNGAGVEL